MYVAGQAQQSDRRTAVVMGRTRVMNGNTLEIGRTHEGSGKIDGMAGRTAVVMGRTAGVNGKTMEIGRTHEMSEKKNGMSGKTMW